MEDQAPDLVRRFTLLAERAGRLLLPRRPEQWTPPAVTYVPPPPPSPNLRLIAPPASGKTTFLARRVVGHIAGGRDPSRFVLLARDDRAVAILRQAVECAAASAGVAGDGLVVDSIDRYAYKLLRAHFAHEYRPVAPEATRRRLCRDVLAALEATSADHAAALPRGLGEDAYLALFALLKNHAIDPREPSAQQIADLLIEHPAAHGVVGAGRDPEHIQRVVQAVYWLFRAYDLALRNELCIDREDRKLRLYACLGADPTARAQVRAGIDELLVDNFHDVSRLDFLLLREIAANGALTVAGDDDQPIDRTAGCSPEFLLGLPEHLERGCRTETIDEVYECPRDVVARADQLIAYSRARIDKQLRARSAEDGLVVSPAASTFDGVRRIVELLDREEPAAIVARSGATTCLCQLGLLVHGRPYDVPMADDVLATGAVERALGLLRLSSALTGGSEPAAPDARLAIGALFPDAPLDAVDAALRDRSFLVAIDQPAMAALLPDLGQALAQVVAAPSPGAALTAAAGWARRAGDELVTASLEGLADLAAELGEDMRHLAWTLEDVLDRAHLKQADHPGRVELLRYEAVHGCRWPTVVLMDCNETLLPGEGALVQDERRRLYDAMLRASRRLIVCYVDAPNAPQPSRFLFESGIL
ncbi:MAG TPA: UvrD-helicase domain-containing protein [Chloroflexota bacterium]|nr:UvrD-helicase domain-containing protein [Chloroflexota bacterium]